MKVFLIILFLLLGCNSYSSYWSKNLNTNIEIILLKNEINILEYEFHIYKEKQAGLDTMWKEELLDIFNLYKVKATQKNQSFDERGHIFDVPNLNEEAFFEIIQKPDYQKKYVDWLRIYIPDSKESDNKKGYIYTLDHYEDYLKNN